ncbi:hypothetical protein PUNSTDRAFT_128030 [Punctularia strigosozonata HHB-11173 SS5]|uniref:Uncharacterized protein n=1 Tax=Punctularia strigosozonata (strain HHB-11173) TaxID=741275 RepID=R7S5X4_PUNST|nr:uncharacterized protein PUNSTDRAFT_128030 [Punctularia strigosozonata HHB-11173 SS5]EIN05221.1 hypothetical protein PUNSTDRAFT_128030 [Punctularia strigosozonata HHB-11173 SS5]
MAVWSKLAVLSVLAGLASTAIASAVDLSNIVEIDVRASDPCTKIAGVKWAAPADVWACYTSFPVNQTEKANIIEVVTKTLAFHTSVNYEFLAPLPFSLDVHEDVLGDLSRISKQSYNSDFDLHIDLSRTLKRLMDGHCVYINDCYDFLDAMIFAQHVQRRPYPYSAEFWEVWDAY